MPNYSAEAVMKTRQINQLLQEAFVEVFEANQKMSSDPGNSELISRFKEAIQQSTAEGQDPNYVDFLPMPNS